MSVSLLSEEQVAALRCSPHVAAVTARQISFTAEFKQHFYEEYMRGVSPNDILRAAGIDPEWIGESRMVSIRVHALRQAQSGRGFTDRKLQWNPDTRYGNQARNDAERIARLEHELAYVRQELEFVKK